jgi:hypothetical protein
VLLTSTAPAAEGRRAGIGVLIESTPAAEGRRAGIGGGVRGKCHAQSVQTWGAVLAIISTVKLTATAGMSGVKPPLICAPLVPKYLSVRYDRQ